MRGCFVTVVAAFLLVFGTASVFYVQATWFAFVFVGLVDPLRVDDLLPSRPATKIPSGQMNIYGDCTLYSGQPPLCQVHSWRRLKFAPALSQRLLYRSASHPRPRLPSVELPAPARGISSCGGASGLRQPSGRSVSSPRFALLWWHFDLICPALP